MLTRRSSVLALCALCALSFSCRTTPATTPDPSPKAPVLVKVFAINDLHGHMEGPSGHVKVQGQKVDAGGLDALAAHLNRLRAEHPHSAFVCAGDLVNASPLISALFHDEPTVEAMNALNMDLLAVGNHEFDDGVEELLRLRRGGCHPETGCKGKDAYPGASFPFLAANVRFKDTKAPLFEPYVVKTYDGVKVGFIGLTFTDTPSAVTPEAVKSVEFLDEVQTVNTYARELQAAGVQAIVVVIHEGASTTSDEDINDCTQASGPVIDLTRRFDASVDVVISGHTHQAYNCTVEGKLLTSAKSFGRVLTEIDLTLDPTTGHVLSKKARNLATTRDVPLDPAMAQHIARYRELVSPLADQAVGLQAEDLLRQPNEAGESSLGMLIADAQLLETSKTAGAQLALMNLGGVRNDLKVAPTGQEDAGVITYSEAHSVQPFGNTLVTMTLTGEQLKALLELQFRPDRHAILQPSSGFTYTWRESAPQGQRVLPQSIMLHGEPVTSQGRYRVTVNSFLASGGDNFPILAQGQDRVGGRVDLDVFIDHLRAHQPLSPPKPGRIVKAP